MAPRLTIAALAAAVFIAAALWLRSAWQAPLAVPADGVLLQVRSGSSLASLARDLEARGLLRHPTLLRVAGRLSGADARIRAGEYRLTHGITAAGLLALLQSGDTVRYLVTLPEGIRLRDALSLLQAADGIEPVLDGEADPRLLALVDPELASAEGYFLPETYQYQRGDSDLSILREAHRLAREALAAAWARRDPGLPYASPHEALIMASIIEKETAVPEERPLISGVFVRRLERGMRLQTDPTVIYGLGAAFDGNLRREHLRDDTNPFNTYRHSGLPPAPIALPGRASIDAALAPAPGDALYFVARGDGTHAFSATLEAHEAAVREYQLQRRTDYRSRPEARR